MKVQEARRITCPRCAAPVTGEFKFCPACACRLQPGISVETPPPAAGWPIGSALVLLGALVITGGLLFFGLRLFGNGREPARAAERPGPLTRPLTVHDIPDELRHLPAGVAYYRPILVAVPSGPMDIMRYEVTRGQWEEFLLDVQADPSKVPEFLRTIWRTDPEYAEEYVLAWWDQVAEHLRETMGKVVERPARFHPPLDDATGTLLLVPPSWTYLTALEEIGWKMPRTGLGLLPENLPVTEVSWLDAVAFATWASQRLGMELWLPSETQWRRAAHGSDPLRRWPWGDDPLPYACNNLNFWGDTDRSRPLPVDFLYSDAPGTTDEGVSAMSGNAAEWVYPQRAIGEVTDEGDVKTEIDKGAQRAKIYGGSFRDGLNDCETGSVRDPKDKRDRFDDVGFRLLVLQR